MERCISDLDRIDSALLFGLVPFLHKVLLITLCPVGVEAGLLWANKALDILSFVLSQGRVSREPFPGSLYAVFVDFGERSSGIVRERRVHVWTVNDPADMRRLRDIGVDGIFSDDPILALQNFK